jgi:hypothetical protein
MKRRILPNSRQHSSSTCVPYVLFMVKASELPKELSTWVCGRRAAAGREAGRSRGLAWLDARPPVGPGARRRAQCGGERVARAAQRRARPGPPPGVRVMWAAALPGSTPHMHARAYSGSSCGAASGAMPHAAHTLAPAPRWEPAGAAGRARGAPPTAWIRRRAAHLRREVHHRVDVLRLQDEAHQVRALDVALDELRRGGGRSAGAQLPGRRSPRAAGRCARLPAACRRTLKLGMPLTDDRLFREAQYSMESNTTTLTPGWFLIRRIATWLPMKPARRRGRRVTMAPAGRAEPPAAPGGAGRRRLTGMQRRDAAGAQGSALTGAASQQDGGGLVLLGARRGISGVGHGGWRSAWLHTPRMGLSERWRGLAAGF